MDYFGLKKNILIICLLFVLPYPCFASTLTLEQCINRGLTHNPEVEAYRLAIDEASEGINEAWGAFLPTLSIGYNHSELSNGNSSESDTDYLDQNSDNFSCRLTQPLFTGLAGVAGLERARRSLEYRQVELTYMKKQLVREISTSFYSLLYARQRAEQWKKSIQRLEQQKNIATAWVEQRLAPRLRLYEIEVELSNANHELIRARADQAVASSQLRQWLAYEPDYEAEINGDLQQEIILPCLELDGCFQQALAHRPEIELSRLNIEMARQDAKIIMARNLPQVSIDGSWTDYQRDYEDSRYPDNDRDYYSVSLNMSMKLFQGGKNISAWRRQNIKVDRLRQQQLSQRHTIISEVQTRFEQLKESRAGIDNAKNGLVKAREAYNFSAKSVELGILSLNDLLSAEIRLTQAEINKIDAVIAHLQARVWLDYVVSRPLLEE